jgi:hypothetical protein
LQFLRTEGADTFYYCAYDSYYWLVSAEGLPWVD